MKDLFSEERRLQRLLDVEAALARAHAAAGTIPPEAAEEIARKATTAAVPLERVRAIEAAIGHDIMAVVVALTEACAGDAGRYVHLGATSNDIADTATALQLKEALAFLEQDLVDLRDVLLDLAAKHRDTIMVGRTHGQAAVPLTFGLKLAVYATEVDRHLERLRQAAPRILVGKMSGAVGTGAALGEHALAIQEQAMTALGLGVEDAASQIVGRDRYAEFAALMANVAASCEKFATEVRNLQRTEIAEVAEAFGESQVGSSTMAQKENPVTSENVCSLARIVRAFLVPALENVPLWHERDLTNSAAERIWIPHVAVLADDILAKTAEVYRNLRVFPDRMRANLDATQGQVLAEAVLGALVGKGLGRQEAHGLVQEAAREARDGGVHLREALRRHVRIGEVLTAEEIDALMRPEAYLGRAGAIVDAVVAKYR
jgi:adenylosuccinate lyase